MGWPQRQFVCHHDVVAARISTLQVTVNTYKLRGNQHTSTNTEATPVTFAAFFLSWLISLGSFLLLCGSSLVLLNSIALFNLLGGESKLHTMTLCKCDWLYNLGL